MTHRELKNFLDNSWTRVYGNAELIWRNDRDGIITMNPEDSIYWEFVTLTSITLFSEYTNIDVLLNDLHISNGKVCFSIEM